MERILQLTAQKAYLSSYLGSSWIAIKKLPTSEVELSMFLKALRKNIYFEFLHHLDQSVSVNNKLIVLTRAYAKYRTFYELHTAYYEGKNNTDAIHAFIPNALIFDSGIPRDRFNHLLPLLLKKINPQELELCYSINTLYRLGLAKDIQRRTSTPLSVRGSLLFFNARSFGISNNANFVALEPGDTPLGSDLDIRYPHNSALQPHNELSKHCLIEFAPLTPQSKDDIFPIAAIDQLIETYCTVFPAVTKVEPPHLLSSQQLQKIKRSTRATAHTLSLSRDSIARLVQCFEYLMHTYGANDEIVASFSGRMHALLIALRKETNFYGMIPIRQIRALCTLLFLGSGYRFSKKDTDMLFEKLIDAYNTLTYNLR